MLISGIKMNLNHTDDDLKKAVIKKYGQSIEKFKIRKKSIDARRGDVSFIYTVELPENGCFLSDIRLDIPKAQYGKRPIVIGSGPAGLFAALTLAKAGLKPIVLERGADVDTRRDTVKKFQLTRQLNGNTNIQFGEGGAGTFSDGKLTTQRNNPLCKEVLNIFVDNGAPSDILYNAKPHIGTDLLIDIIKNIRISIEKLGGTVVFNSAVCDMVIHNGSLKKIVANNEYETDFAIAAIGHSARDTFKMMLSKEFNIIPKAFSVGARIEHPQNLVNECQYGKYAENKNLGAADYKLAYHTKSGRGVYTFCMCPGGMVVGAASEENTVVTNGMSYHLRGGKNANAAFLVSVTPSDFGTKPLDGIQFQQMIERNAYALGGNNYSAPCQKLGDFLNDKCSDEYFGDVTPTYLPGVKPTNINSLLPKFVTDSMKEAVGDFSRKLKCFGIKNAVLTAPETRSSSPVRIVRNEKLMSNFYGIYPCGEGAGYAGGIMSAAADGIHCALKMIDEINEKNNKTGK